MPPKLLEIRPDRLHLDPNFNGYKLCLDRITSQTEKLDIGVRRALPSNDQYSFLHTKLFGLHNYLIGEVSGNDECGCVYFIDKSLHVQKVYVDNLSNSLTIIKVWEIPNNRERKEGDYNYSLKFASESLGVVSDGTGLLYIVNTGSRDNDDSWQNSFCDEVLGSDKRFVIQDVVYKDSKLHCLLYDIEQESSTKKHSSILYWVTLTQSEDKSWGATALRELKSKSDIYYAYIERDTGNAIYCVSDAGCTFSIDSENPIKDKPKDDSQTIYEWLQTDEDITLKFKLPEDYVKEDVHVNVQDNEININYQDRPLLAGNLYHRINAEITTSIKTNTGLELTLFKEEKNLMWPEVVEGDQTGKCIIDSAVIEEANRRLQHLCSETEVPQVQCEQGPTFSSQEIEECDFEDDKLIIFERLCCNSHEVTHRANLGSHHILLTTWLSQNVPPAMAVRYDVDGCLWQPRGNGDNFCLKHEGTLLAFGYIQASKQQKKFCACAPNLNYSVICEYNRHLFIYRQNKAINNAELRNRTTGQRFGTIAQQQVINISDEEVLGLYACNSTLFLLTEYTITVYQL